MRKRRTAAKRQTLYIKNPAAHRLAVQLSKETGLTLSDAVIQALEEKVQRTKRPLDRKKIEALSRQMRALPVIDSRAPDEIVGYDQFGIPQ